MIDKTVSRYIGEGEDKTYTKEGDYHVFFEDSSKMVIVTYKGKAIAKGDYDKGFKTFFIEFLNWSSPLSKTSEYEFDDGKAIVKHAKKWKITK